MSNSICRSTKRPAARPRAPAPALGVVIATLAAACAPDGGALPPERAAGAAAAPLLAWTHVEEVVPADGMEQDLFGQAAALSGDTALVGAPGGPGGTSKGAVYVLERDTSGWSTPVKLTAADALMGDRFGQAVALSGDTALVGAPGSPGDPSSGEAYVFVRDASGWSAQAKLMAEGGPFGGAFGASVAAAGDTAAVGSERSDDQGEDSGAAYVFVRSGSAWAQEAKLTATDGAADDRFGQAVALSGDVLVVGAPLADAEGENSGAAYVFVRSGSAWAQEVKLTAPDGAAGDVFGRSVAAWGDTVVVGAPMATGNVYRSGAAYVFVRDGGAWDLQAKLVAGDGAADDLIAFSVALAGDTAAVGALWDNDAALDAGAIHVFERSGAAWSQVAKLLAPDAAGKDLLGCSVAVSAGAILAGAARTDAAGIDSGAAHLFELRHWNGDPCADAGQCASGFCVDGVCCDTGCDAAGVGCSAEVKGHGDDGVCGPIGGAAAAGGAGGAGAIDAGGASGSASAERSYYGCATAPWQRGSRAPLLAAALAVLGAVRARRRRSACAPRARRGRPADGAAPVRGGARSGGRAPASARVSRP